MTEEFVGDNSQLLRILEAMLFAAAEPLTEATMASRLPEGTDIPALLEELSGHYANRGVNLVRVGSKWALRTAPDVAPALRLETEVPRKLSQAALETLAIIAYHQPVTRAEIEEIRGKALSRGTLDTLLEAGWVRPKGRRRTPGRPVTWGTSDEFLDQFGLESVDDLPGIEELKAAGLIDQRPSITAYARLSADARKALGIEDAISEATAEEEAGEDDENDEEDGGEVPLEAVEEEL
ncbi:MAG: SMC-Scp complex subunit ScpB [Alphaproteobacteria bacterium]|nr:SMC-Scp complex subunit ScpB [Alphaproteobacteria bacterium]